MKNSEILRDKRFVIAVQRGEHTRAVSVFLKIKFPGVDISTLPRSELINASLCRDNAFAERWSREKELAQEMR
jgi:hypothetical protein